MFQKLMNILTGDSQLNALQRELNLERMKRQQAEQENIFLLMEIAHIEEVKNAEIELLKIESTLSKGDFIRNFIL